MLYLHVVVFVLLPLKTPLSTCKCSMFSVSVYSAVLSFEPHVAQNYNLHTHNNL